MIAPTARQLAIVAFWHAFTVEHGYPPSLREACAFFGYRSTNAAAAHARCCIRKGLLRSSGGWNSSRGVIVTPLGRSLVGAAPPQRSRVATGTVIPEQKCGGCGASHFLLDERLCASCVRAA